MKRATPLHLIEDERTYVEVFVRRGRANARTLARLFAPITKPHTRPPIASCDTGQSTPRPAWLF